MKPLFILCAWLFAACTFDTSGLPPKEGPDGGMVGTDADSDQDGDGSDAGSDVDPDAGPDSAVVPAGPPAIVCSYESIDGQSKQVLSFSGDIEAGFLAYPVPADGAVPVAIEYGSELEDAGNLATCGSSWAVPYQAGCTKPRAAWSSAPTLVLEPEADRLNLALRYSDGTVRWGDLKTADGDPPGFVVSGSGSDPAPGFDCRIEVVNDGNGGLFLIDL